MIPKSLVICVVTGVAAAAIMGIYLQQQNSKNIAFINGASITGYVEKNTYKIGQTIPIYLVNSGTTKIEFASNSPGIFIRALDGTIFFTQTLSGLNLEPEQKHVFEWEQQKNDDSKILEGRYVVEIIAFDESGKKVDDSFTLDLLK
ncbi:MAG: hypothetical protein ACKO7N_04130 [Candidatus Nitrosotenuis sp.]